MFWGWLLPSKEIRQMTTANLANGLLSRLSKRMAHRRDYDLGKVYGSYGLSDEVDLAIDIVNSAKDSYSIILDVGANKGDYSGLAAARLDNSSVIHCFEPSMSHEQSLRSLQNKYIGRILYYPCGLSSTEGSKDLYKDSEGSGLSSLYYRDVSHYGINFTQKELVRMTTLDHWLNSSGISRITFLKVDVEGHELEVFKGGSHVLSSGLVNALQFEFGGCNIDSRTYFKDFFSLLHIHHGFSLYRLAPRKRLVDMNRYSEVLECFTWQNIVGFMDKAFIPSTYTIVYE
jgi:FkbM family methyltransferase